MPPKRSTVKAKRVQGDQIMIPLSSGYTVVIRRPQMNMIRAILQKAEEDFPFPEAPSIKMETVTGREYRVAVDTTEKLIDTMAGRDDDAEAEALKQEYHTWDETRSKAEEERQEYFLDYIFKKRLEVHGYETSEKREELTASFADDLAELAEWGTMPAELAEMDAWQQTLRLFIVADSADFVSISLAAMKALDVADITEDEIRKRMSFL